MIVGTRELRPQSGGRFLFDPGSLCLEMLLTGGPEPYDRYEILRAPADLAAWLVDSRLAATAPLAVDDLLITPADLHEIRRFRDTMWSIAPVVAHGGRPAAADLEVINAAAGPPPRPALDPVTGERRWAAPVTGAQVLGAAARDAIDVLSGDTSRLRQCAGPNCRLLFLDTSRPGNRRWCSMQRCGNRHKVNSHRGRRESAG